MRVSTSPAAIGQHNFNLNYIPQFLMWEQGADPITNLRVEEQTAGVLCDLPLAGLTEVRKFMRFGDVDSTFSMIRLANGHIKNANVTVSASIAAAVAVPFYTSSDSPGNLPMKYQAAAILASTPMIFQDFSALFLPGLQENDSVLIEYHTGHTQLFNRSELLELAAQFQNSQASTNYVVNNVNAYIRKVTVTQAAAGTAYVMKANL